MTTTTADRLVLFARYPEPGKVKTRLIPKLGPEVAAQLYREMMFHTLAQVSPLRSAGVRVEIRHTGADAARMRDAFGDADYVDQGDGDLGERLWPRADAAFADGAARVALIGSDCPGLTTRILADAFALLRKSQVVVGPAIDGGYYLLGMSRPTPELFQDVEWGTQTVLAGTLKAVRRLKLSLELLPILSDVDRPEDLKVWEAVKKARRT